MLKKHGMEPSRVYDTLMRLPILTWSTAVAVWSLVSLHRYACELNRAVAVPVYVTNVAMRLSVIAYLLIIAGTAFARTCAMGKAGGVEPRISAVIGTFLTTVLLLFPRRELPLSESVISTLLILTGNTLAASVILKLRRSFSIMPEARQLITSGPYHFIRHPLYLAEAIAASGALMQFISAWTIVIMAIQIGFQFRRMHNEERILMKWIPEYSIYRSNTARIIPGIL